VDAGDRLRPDAIRTYLRAVISDPRVSFVYSDAGHLGTKQGVAHGRPFSARALAKKNFIHTGVLIKREAFEAVGGYPHLTSRVAEDWDLLLSLAEHGHRGLYVPRALLDRREQGGSGRNSAEPGEYNRLREDMNRRHPRLDPMGRLRCVRAWRRWVFRDS
jgi:GT2 family glycosyltransferase